MPRDASQFYTAEPNGFGGVRLIPRVQWRDSAALRASPVDAAVLQRIRDGQARIAARDGLLSTATSGIKAATSGIKAAASGLHKLTSAAYDDGDDPDAFGESGPRTEDGIVGVLPPAPDGMHYEIITTENGPAIVLENGPMPTDAYELAEETTGDRRRIGDRLHGPDPLLRAMNIANRRAWRDARRFRDADTPTPNTGRDMERLVYLLPNAGEGGRYELRENDNGTVQIVWIGPSTSREMLQGPALPGTAEDQRTTPVRGDPMHGFIPLGASGQGPEVRSSSPPSRTADRDKLRQINRSNRAFWARGPR